MYKLVVVAGKLRGKEFTLQEGDNTIGRSEECTLHINVPGVSKVHLNLTVSADTVYAEDQGSSNGTFVNGKHITRATLKKNDKIALPNLILQLVYVKEKKVVIEKKIKSEKETDEFSNPTPPDNFVEKVFFIFKYRVMSIIYGINEEYEWKALLGVLVTLFAVSTISATIIPVMSSTKEFIIKEAASRGKQYVEEIHRVSSIALAKGDLDTIDTSFLDGANRKEKGIDEYVVFDSEGRIVRPFEKRNEFVSDSFYVAVKNNLKSNAVEGSSFATTLGDFKVGVGKKIESFNIKTGTREAVGYIAIKFAPSSLKYAVTENKKIYLESLLTSFLIGVLFFGFIYHLTTRPLAEFHYQIEECLRGARKNVVLKHLSSELKPLVGTANSMLMRIRELQNEELDADFVDIESDETYIATLVEFLNGATGAALILDSQKRLARMNSDAERILEFREDSSQGADLMDVGSKQFNSALLEACNSSELNSGTSQETEIEVDGRVYAVFATSLFGKDNMAKAFYITVKEVGSV